MHLATLYFKDVEIKWIQCVVSKSPYLEQVLISDIASQASHPPVLPQGRIRQEGRKTSPNFAIAIIFVGEKKQ